MTAGKSGGNTGGNSPSAKESCPHNAADGSPDKECQTGSAALETASTRGGVQRCQPKRPPNQTPHRLWDGGGLYLEVDLSGSKWWRWKYRFGGKEKRLSLGVYPEVSLADAREEMTKYRKLLKNGTDPAEHRRALKAARKDRAADSFEVIAREWLEKFVDSAVEGHKKRVYARFENDVFPWIRPFRRRP